jgi:putative SOS response-associated peptidase YedK
MPVMLPPSAWDAWLDRDNGDLEALGKLLVPVPASLLDLHPVSRAVNNVQDNGPELIDPVPEDPGQDTLL